jgi:hypothetical protein
MVIAASATVQTRAAGLNCPKCGASIALGTAGWSVTVVCATCGAVLDAQDPNLRILQQHERQIMVQPHIPMGTRGKWKGIAWDVVGFQQMTIAVEGVLYSWLEYVCFNPYHGFMYLSEYEGHWNVIQKLHKRPDVVAGDTHAINFDGRTYKHFQSASATTTFALGEFPWEVNVGDSVQSHDYVSPPYMLSAEGTPLETTWSLGTYTDAEAIGRAFSVASALRKPVGVFANQPNLERRASRGIMRAFSVCVLLLVVMLIANVVLSRRENVFDGKYRFDRLAGDTAAFVTDPFELKGRESNVDITIDTNLENNWIFLGLALIDENSGQAFDVGREVSYYHGSDSDGSWSEGSTSDHFKMGSVPSGTYVLRVGPEQDGDVSTQALPPVTYSIHVKRDVPSYLFYVFAFFALAIPALLSLAPAVTFETARWAESDHAPSLSNASSEDDD